MSPHTRSETSKTTTSGRRHPPRFPSLLFALLLLAGALGVSATASAQAQPDGCSEREKNIQCNAFGYISMDSQTNIRGEPVPVTVDIEIENTFREYDARWIMISVRNITDDLRNPVMIRYDGFETPHGKVVTENVEQPSANELAIWMHVLDTPVDTPMKLETTIGASERGAYRLEALVMVFDRGYEPIVGPDGEEISLFSFSLLGVNEETSELKKISSDGESRFRQLPAVGFVPALLAMFALVAVRLRRDA